MQVDVFVCDHFVQTGLDDMSRNKIPRETMSSVGVEGVRL
jgi:hypothetical protein